MPKPMHVVPEAMQADGQQLTGLGQSMAGGLNGLASTIQGDGNPWGGDEQGTLFGQLYQVVLGKAFQGIASHVEQVQYAGSALSAQAKAYADLESSMSSTLQGMSGQIAG